MKHIIFSDVDGTIYPYGPSTISQKTINDIVLAQKKDIYFIPITGNAHLSTILELSNLIQNRFLITSNGASIYDFETKSFIKKIFFSKKEMEIFKNIFETFNLSFLGWNDQEKRVFTKDVSPNQEVTNMIVRKTISLTEELEDFDFDNLLSAFFIFGSKEELDEVQKILENEKLNYWRIRAEAISVAPQDVNKKNALLFMKDYLKIDLNNVMVIGDGENDQEILSIDQVFSYALDNATQETKNCSKYYTCSVEQNGLGMAILDFLHRKKIEH